MYDQRRGFKSQLLNKQTFVETRKGNGLNESHFKIRLARLFCRLLFERTFSPHESADRVKALEFHSHSLSVRSLPADFPNLALSVQSC